jgi:hypothetical protein
MSESEKENTPTIDDVLARGLGDRLVTSTKKLREIGKEIVSKKLYDYWCVYHGSVISINRDTNTPLVALTDAEGFDVDAEDLTSWIPEKYLVFGNYSKVFVIGRPYFNNDDQLNFTTYSAHCREEDMIVEEKEGYKDDEESVEDGEDGDEFGEVEDDEDEEKPHDFEEDDF